MLSFVYHIRFNDPLKNKGVNKSFSTLSKVRSSRTFNYLMNSIHYILGCLKVRITLSISTWWNTEYLNFEYSLAYRLEAVIFRALQSCSNFAYNRKEMRILRANIRCDKKKTEDF
jgi:hypothetical protein